MSTYEINRDMHDATWYVVETKQDGTVVEHREFCELEECEEFVARMGKEVA